MTKLSRCPPQEAFLPVQGSMRSPDGLQQPQKLAVEWGTFHFCSGNKADRGGRALAGDCESGTSGFSAARRDEDGANMAW